MRTWGSRQIGAVLLAGVYLVATACDSGGDGAEGTGSESASVPIPTSTEDVQALLVDMTAAADEFYDVFQALKADSVLLEGYLEDMDFEAWDAYWETIGLARYDQLVALAEQLKAQEAAIEDVQGSPVDAIPGWGQQQGSLEICVVTIFGAGLAAAALITSLRASMESKSDKLEAIRERVKTHFLAKGKTEQQACIIADAWALKGVPLAMLGTAVDTTNNVTQATLSQAAPVIPSVTKTGEMLINATSFTADGATVILNYDGASEYETLPAPLLSGGWGQQRGAQSTPSAIFVGRIENGVVPNVPYGKWEGNIYPKDAAPLRVPSLDVNSVYETGVIITGQPYDEIDCGEPDVTVPDPGDPEGGPIAEGEDGPGTSWVNVSWINRDLSMGTGFGGSEIQLSGDAARPTIEWNFTGAQTITVIDQDAIGAYGIRSEDESDQGIALYIESPVDFGDYRVALTIPIHGSGSAPDLVAGRTYTFAVSDWGDTAAILVATLQ